MIGGALFIIEALSTGILAVLAYRWGRADERAPAAKRREAELILLTEAHRKALMREVERPLGPILVNVLADGSITVSTTKTIDLGDAMATSTHTWTDKLSPGDMARVRESLMRRWPPPRGQA